jgi:hypothetical protein
MHGGVAAYIFNGRQSSGSIHTPIHSLSQQGFAFDVLIAGIHNHQKRTLLKGQQIRDPLIGRNIDAPLNR